MFFDCPSTQLFVYDCLCLCLCRNLFKISVCLLICLLIRLSLNFTVYQSICLSADLIWWSYSIVKKPQCMEVLFFHIEYHIGVWYYPCIVVFNFWIASSDIYNIIRIKRAVLTDRQIDWQTVKYTDKRIKRHISRQTELLNKFLHRQRHKQS